MAIFQKFCYMVLMATLSQSASSDSYMTKFQQAHSCEIEETTKKTDGFAPYTITQMVCKGLTPSTVRYATCGKRCRDPVLREPLSEKFYRVEPITMFQPFTSVKEGDLTQEITLSCRCVATKKGLRKCRGKKKKRGCKRLSV